MAGGVILIILENAGVSNTSIKMCSLEEFKIAGVIHVMQLLHL